ncbi:MAG: hypothetical protein ACJARE_001571 [Paracoccaceae bacterium]|jgi:hypothetical protein
MSGRCPHSNSNKICDRTGNLLYADKGYVSAEREATYKGLGKILGLCERPRKAAICINSTITDLSPGRSLSLM